MFEQAMFYFFAIVAVVSAMFVVTGKNPISCAIALIVTLGALAGVFVLEEAHFVATIQILVYTGAIMVLFVFVIMLLNLGPEDLEKTPRFTRLKVAGWLFAAAGAGLLIWNFASYTAGVARVTSGYGTLEQISQKLFTEYLVPFEAISVVLMAAVVGAVVIAKREL